MKIVLGRKALVVGVATVGGVVGAWALAGDINPPAGPVAPTMRTLSEVYEAAAAGGGAGDAHCGPGMHGTIGMLGRCSIPALPGAGPNPVFDVIKFSQTSTKAVPLGGGGGGGTTPAMVGDFVLTKALDGATAGLFRAMTSGQAFASITVTLNNAANNPVSVVTLKNCYITARDIAMDYRCDGVTVMTERVSINATTVRYTDSVTGQVWEFNFATQAGNTG